MSSDLNNRDSLPHRHSVISLPDSAIEQSRKCRIPRPEKNENRTFRRSNSFHLSSPSEKPSALFSRSESFTLDNFPNFDSRMTFKNSLEPILQRNCELPIKSKDKFRPCGSVSTFGSVSNLMSTPDVFKNNLHKYCHSPSKKNVCHCQFRYNSEEYITPTQRYQRDIRRLKVLLEKAHQELELKAKENVELKTQICELRQARFNDNILPEPEALRSRSSSKTSDSGNFEMEGCIKKTQATLEAADTKMNESSSLTIEKAKERISELENQIQKIKEQQYEQEQKHSQTYLEMYKKGQEAAKFQHADEVLEFAHQAPNRVSVPELLKQLHLTEQELNQMKNLYRVDIYNKEKEFCDAEITLRFLKDAIYYYLTDKNNKCHLTAIENIAGFSEREKMNIAKALLTRH